MENITELENNVSGSKVSRKSFFIKLFFILIVLVILGVLGFVFRDRLLELLSFKNTTSVSNPQETEDNIFGNLLPEVKELNFENLDPQFKEEIQPLINGQGEFIDWYHIVQDEKPWIFGQIKSVDGDSIGINISRSVPMGLVEATYSCPQEKSILLARKNLEILDTNINVSDLIKPGYLLYIKCLNEDCTQLGDSCILVKMD